MQSSRLPDHRQINLAMLSLMAVGTFAWGIIALAVADATAPVALAGSIVYLALCIAYLRGWEQARYLAVALTVLITGLLLPEPFVSETMPAEVLFPVVFALVMAGPFWMIGSMLGTVAMLLIRAGGVGIYAELQTWISLVMLVGGMVLSHALTRRARAEAETRAAELKVALDRTDAQTRILARQRDELRFQANLLGLMNDAVLAIDQAGHVTYWNAAAERLFGFSAAELLGRSVLNIVVEPSERVFAERDLGRVARGEGFVGERTLRRRNGELFPAAVAETILYDDQGVPQGVLSVISDLSARKLMEQQLTQARRLESIGRLAGGVAHDFNNMLTVIGGHAVLARDTLEPQHPAYDDLTAIITATERAGTLTHQLLAFGRGQVLSPQPVDLNNLVEGLLPLLKRLINESITLELNLTPNLPLIRIDVGQIEQVLINLCVNARDAMPSGGRLTLATLVTTLQAADLAGEPGLKPGAYVTFTVRDTGVGMAPETQQRAFEPFFTTKALGSGTGLGLAICYGIVRQHEGRIVLSSAVGAGTTVQVYLPVGDRF